MRKSFFAPIVALFLTAGIVSAASITVKDGTGASQSVMTFAFNGLQAYGEALIDTTGAQIDPATKQGQTAMTTPMTTLAGTVAAVGSPAATAQTVQAASWPLSAGAATFAGQTANTSAITATQSPAGTLAVTGQTVTTVLPQITSTTGLANSFSTTAATLFNANAARHFMTIQVQGAPDTTGTNGCYINGIGGATADANSLFVARGGYYESATHVGPGAISIICTGTMAVYSRQG